MRRMQCLIRQTWSWSEYLSGTGCCWSLHVSVSVRKSFASRLQLSDFTFLKCIDSRALEEIWTVTSPFRCTCATASRFSLNAFHQEPTDDVLLDAVRIIGWPGSQTILNLSTWTCLICTTLPQVYHAVIYSPGTRQAELLRYTVPWLFHLSGLWPVWEGALESSQLILSVKNAHFVRCSMLVFACLICDTRIILATTLLALTIGCMPPPPSEPPALINHRVQTLLAPTTQLKDILLLFVTNSPSCTTRDRSL